MPNGVKDVGDGAFCSCAEPTSIALPDLITKIGMFAFENRFNLESVELPKELEEIGSWALSNCPKLLFFNIE